MVYVPMSNRPNVRQQYQFRPEKRVRVCLDACLGANEDRSDSEILNLLVALGLKSLGLDPWVLPEPAQRDVQGRTYTTYHILPKDPLVIPTTIEIPYAVSTKPAINLEEGVDESDLEPVWNKGKVVSL